MTRSQRLLGRTLAARYRLDKEGGRGGMATVFLAQDLKHGRPVALKVMREEIAITLGADRFLQEIRIAKAVTVATEDPSAGMAVGTPAYMGPER